MRLEMPDANVEMTSSRYLDDGKRFVEDQWQRQVKAGDIIYSIGRFARTGCEAAEV